MLDLESELMRGLGSIPLGVTFSTGFFCFHIAKPLLPILALLPFLCISIKLLLLSSQIFRLTFVFSLYPNYIKLNVINVRLMKFIMYLSV